MFRALEGQASQKDECRQGKYLTAFERREAMMLLLLNFSTAI